MICKILIKEKVISINNNALLLSTPSSKNICKKILKNKKTQINSSNIKEYPLKNFKKKEFVIKLKNGNDTKLKLLYFSE